MTVESKAFCMLFSDKSTVPPLFRALAIEFEGQIGFGMANVNDKQVAGRFNVDKAPTFLLMFPDEQSKDESGNVKLAGMNFDTRQHGKFNFANLASFVASFLQMRAQSMGGGAGGAGGTGGGGGGGASTVTVVPSSKHAPTVRSWQ